MLARPSWATLAALVCCLSVPLLEGPGASGAQPGWSSPAQLPGCAAATGPAVAFPSASPSIPTGPGAIVWTQTASCPADTAPPSAGAFQLAVSAVGAGEHLGPTVTQSSPSDSVAALRAGGASFGRVLVAEAPRRGPGLTVLQGRAGGLMATTLTLPDAGHRFSLGHAYLGDAAVAAVVTGPAIEVRVERYFRSRFGPPARIPIAPGHLTALTATLDYRSDVLVAWQQDGAIYAHMLRASGRAEPTQLVGSSQASPQLQALVSDNDHGMIAWSSTTPGPAPRTRVRIALSGAGVSFAGSRLVASFGDPQRVGSVGGSLALVRLSTENVMLAWTEVDGGRYVVRAVPAVFAARRSSTRLSDPASQSVLAGLTPGPAGEAVALWRSARLPYGPGALWAARATIHSRVGSRAPEEVAPAGLHVGASIAVDPASDRAVAAWLVPGSPAHIEFAVGPAASGYRPLPLSAAAPTQRGGTDWLPIGLTAMGVVVLAGLTRLALRRRRGPALGGGASRRGRSRRR